MKYLINSSFSFVLLSIAVSTSANLKVNSEYGLSKELFAQADLSKLNRFPPRYPMKEARKGKEGCATVEYIVTAANKVEDIKVNSSTNKSFAAEAKKVIKKWDWQSVQHKPIKTQTRFEFCLDDGNGRCSMSKLLEKTECSGEDVIASVGIQVN